jgi:anti-sigma B factor antagonist
MSPEFSTEVVEEAGRLVIYVRGELDIATCERLRDVIEPNMGPRQTVVLDLSEVEFMDSSSMHVLVQARGELTADGGSLKLRNPSIAARRLLSLVGAELLLDTDAEEQRGD